MTLHVVVVEPDRLKREGLVSLLRERDLEVVRELGSVDELLTIEIDQVDLIVVPSPYYMATVSERNLRLSHREAEALCHAAKGLSNTQIASRMGVAAASVKAYLSHSYRKLGVTNRTQAAQYVREHNGFVEILGVSS